MLHIELAAGHVRSYTSTSVLRSYHVLPCSTAGRGCCSIAITIMNDDYTVKKWSVSSFLMSHIVVKVTPPFVGACSTQNSIIARAIRLLSSHRSNNSK